MKSLKPKKAPGDNEPPTSGGRNEEVDFHGEKRSNQTHASTSDPVATMTIKSSAGKQKYTYDYGTTFPTGGGAGTYGTIALDNYKSKAAGGCAESVGAQAIKITHS